MQFWANVVHNFPVQFPMANGVATVPYQSLDKLNGMLHWQLDPVVSQKSIFGESLGYLPEPLLPPLAPWRPLQLQLLGPGMAKEVGRRKIC